MGLSQCHCQKQETRYLSGSGRQYYGMIYKWGLPTMEVPFILLQPHLHPSSLISSHPEANHPIKVLLRAHLTTKSRRLCFGIPDQRSLAPFPTSTTHPPRCRPHTKTKFLTNSTPPPPHQRLDGTNNGEDTKDEGIPDGRQAGRRVRTRLNQHPIDVDKPRFEARYG